MALTPQQIGRIRTVAQNLNRAFPLATKFGGIQRRFVEGQRQQAQDLSSGIKERISAAKQGREPQLSEGQKQAGMGLAMGAMGMTAPIGGKMINKPGGGFSFHPNKSGHIPSNAPVPRPQNTGALKIPSTSGLSVGARGWTQKLLQHNTFSQQGSIGISKAESLQQSQQLLNDLPKLGRKEVTEVAKWLTSLFIK